MVQTDPATFYRYRMSGIVRVILSAGMLLIPAFIMLFIWSVSRHAIPTWVLAKDILFLPVLLAPLAWVSAWAIVSADCVAEGMYCARVNGAKVFIPWGQVRQFKCSVPSVHCGRKVWRICILRTDDRIPFCFHLDKAEMSRFVAILREASNARIIGFD